MEPSQESKGEATTTPIGDNMRKIKLKSMDGTTFDLEVPQEVFLSTLLTSSL
jgi:hypothetical protein